MAKHLTLLLAVVVTARLAVGALLALRRRRDPTDRPAGALDAVLALDRTGPSDPVVDLARHATLLLAEASHAEQDPADMAGLLSSARDVGAAAAQAGVTR